jgi:hypothetical protein
MLNPACLAISNLASTGSDSPECSNKTLVKYLPWFLALNNLLLNTRRTINKSSNPRGKIIKTKALETSNLKIYERNAINVKLIRVALINFLYSSAPKPRILVSLESLNHRKNDHEINTNKPKNVFLISYPVKFPCKVLGNLRAITIRREEVKVTKSKRANEFLNLGFHSEEEPWPRLFINF